MTRALLIGAGVLMVLCGGLGAYAKHVTTANAALAARIEQYAVTLASAQRVRAALQTELATRDRLLAARDGERHRIAAELRTITRELNDAYTHDAPSREWADQQLPAAVDSILQHAAGAPRAGDHPDVSAAGVDPTHTGAALGRPHER